MSPESIGKDTPALDCQVPVDAFQRQVEATGPVKPVSPSAPPASPGKKFRPPTGADMGKFVNQHAPAQQWVFHDVLPAGIVAAIAAQGGTGKSMLLLQLGVSLATGKRLFDFLRPVNPSRVLILFGEDDEPEVWRRIRRIARVYDLTAQEKNLLEANIRLYCGQSFPLMHTSAKGPVANPSMEWLRKEVEDFQPQLVILDPKSQFFGLNENSNDETTQWYLELRGLTRMGKCSVLVAMHVAKTLEGDMKSAAGRGASANRDDVRSFFTMVPVTETEAKSCGFQNRNLFCKLELSKTNYAPGLASTVYFQREVDSGPHPGCHADPEELEQISRGGVLRQVTDLDSRKREIAHAKDEAAAKTLLELIDSSSELSASDIKRGDEGARIRDTMKREHFLTRPQLLSQLSRLCEQGKLGEFYAEREEGAKGRTKKLLRVAK